MAIEKILVLSTAHIRQQTDTLLTYMATDREEQDTTGDDFIPRYIKYKTHHYGYIIFLYHEYEDLEGLHAELKKADLAELIPIIKYALKRNCYTINIDRDADIIKALATFEWQHE